MSRDETVSQAALEQAEAENYLEQGAAAQAIVHALLSLRNEIRTANLLAVAASNRVPLLDDQWGNWEATQVPEAMALRNEIREELDL